MRVAILIGRLIQGLTETDNLRYTVAPWHFLYFFPEPHGHGSLRPTLGWLRTTVFTLPASSPAAAAPWFGPVKFIEKRRAARRRCSSSGACSATTCRLKSERIVVVSMRSSIA